MECIKTVSNQLNWNYSVSFIRGVFQKNDALARIVNGKKVLIVTTPTVDNLYGKSLRQFLNKHAADTQVLVLSVTEQEKTIANAEKICASAQNFDISRKGGLLIGFGGGVCTDLVAVAASWFNRGVDYLRIPTTLIGQVDAGIGIKGSLNFNNKKSFLGCFYPPTSVFIDPNFLATLPDNLLRSGFAEIIKMALIGNLRLFELIESSANSLIRSKFNGSTTADGDTILKISIYDMLVELESNFYETAVQSRLVDFGHTFSPSLETQSDFSLSHGDAVSIDMALSVAIACVVCWLSEKDYERIMKVFENINIPIFSHLLTPSNCMDSLVKAEKNRGIINLVVPVGIAKADFINDFATVSEKVIEQAITMLRKRSNNLPAIAC